MHPDPVNANVTDRSGGIRKRIPRTVVALGIVSLLTDAATEMIFPLLPVFVLALGSGAVALGVMEGAAESTASLLKLFSGVWSDKLHRRKPFVVVGYTLSTLARPFTALVTSAWQIVAVRMLDRTGKGIRTAPRDALIAATVDAGLRGKSFGFHRAMDHTGAVLGPLLALGALLLLTAGYGITDMNAALRWTFALSIVPGLGAVAVLVFFVREPAEGPHEAKPVSLSMKGFDANFKVYLVTVLLFTLGNSSDAFLLFRVEESLAKSGALRDVVSQLPLLGRLIQSFGDASAQRLATDVLFLPFVWAFFHVIKVLASTPLGALSDRIGRKPLILIGWGVYALVYAAFALLDRLPGPWQIPATLALFAVYALYYGFCEGAEKAFVADLVGSDRRGTAFGLYNFAVGLGALPASLAFGFIYNALGGDVAFGMGAVLAGISMVLLSTFVKEKPKSKYQNPNKFQ